MLMWLMGDPVRGVVSDARDFTAEGPAFDVFVLSVKRDTLADVPESDADGGCHVGRVDQRGQRPGGDGPDRRGPSPGAPPDHWHESRGRQRVFRFCPLRCIIRCTRVHGLGRPQPREHREDGPQARVHWGPWALQRVRRVGQLGQQKRVQRRIPVHKTRRKSNCSHESKLIDSPLEKFQSGDHAPARAPSRGRVRVPVPAYFGD